MAELYAADRQTARGPWVTALAAALMLLGAVAIAASFAATLATVLVFGFLLLLGGGAQLARAWGDRGGDLGWDLFSGILYALTGLLILTDPVSGAVGLTLLMVLFFLLAGAARLSRGWRLRGLGAAGAVLLSVGVLDLVLGVLILAGWPGSAAWVIGLFVGIELFVSGATLLLRGAPRRWSSPRPAPAPTGRGSR